MKPAPQRPFDSPLARKFAGVALLIALPLWALDTFFLVTSIQELRDEAGRQVLRAAESTSGHLEAWYRSQSESLALLANLARARRDTEAELHRHFHEVTRHQPGWLGIALLDSQASVRFYSGIPYGSKVSAELFPADALKMAKAGRPYLSGYWKDPSGAIPVIALMVPIPGMGRSIGLLYQLSQLQGELQEFTGFRGGVLEVLDGKGFLLYHSQDPRRYVGARLSDLVNWPSLGKAEEGTFESTGIDRLERIYAYHKTPLFGWVVVVGESKAFLSEFRFRLLILPLLIDLLAILVTLLLVGILARRFTLPAVELRDIAQQLGAGQFQVRATHLPKDELGDLGRSLNLMAEQLEAFRHNLEQQVAERTRELQTANQDLGAANAQLALANSQLSGTVDELRRLDQQRAEFLNMVSHDLRIPLTALLGYVEFLEDSVVGELNPQQLEYVHQMGAAIERMKKPLDTLLDLARIEAGQLKLSLQSVDIKLLIEETIECLQGLLTQKQQELAIEVPPDLPLVHADPTRIGHVLSNLIANASKFTPSHGKLQIVTERHDHTVRVSVIDNGVGISLADQKHLFERFFRAKATEHLPGTGLGLSISKGIIQAHNGTIGVMSEPGKGSTFWFELPAAQEKDVEDPK